MRLYGIYIRQIPNGYSVQTPQAVVVNPIRHMEILEEEQKDNIEFIDYNKMSWKFRNDDNTYVLRSFNPTYLHMDYSYAKIEL